MSNRRSQFNMAHALTTDLRQGDFNTTLLAYNAAILHPLVLTAQAFIILNRTKDTGAEQSVAFRLKGPIVDGFRFLNFTKRPRKNTVRTRD